MVCTPTCLLLGIALSLLQEPQPAPAPPPPAPIETVQEAATKQPFAVRRSGSAGEEWLLGTGVRTKTIFDVEVYAFGLYAEPYAAQAALAPYRNLGIRELERSSAFYAALSGGTVPLTLRLVFVRNVDGADASEAFETSLRPRIAHAQQHLGKPDASADLERLRSYFPTDKLKKGSEILLSWRPGDVLEISFSGEAKPALTSPGLCWALFDVYLGNDPIEAKGKKTVIARVPELLRSTLPPRPTPTPAPTPVPSPREQPPAPKEKTPPGGQGGR
jgi:hypothetical protein